MATQIILEDGLKAINDFKKAQITPALNRVIESTILLSGVGFESCHLAGPHALHNGLVELEATKNCLHGELVAFGILVALMLNNEEHTSVANDIYDFYSKTNLPMTLKDIGISKNIEENLKDIVSFVCTENSFIYNEPVDITEKILFEAILKTDQLVTN
ncbi:hypothetical protein AZF37_03485 [endosymbiont 'TC1' of Trimyema compressum]|uniref:iron-containing alcohol dehydrogenase n=1 Tax=endosymbiont 'TC1' of Trimyema compressum TaxID=243899 RepID=UPI0007F06786|nr:hypothetical protein AZF37_03485 [endosymbiont 'TC1' of Trimyema compressum]